MKLYRRHLSITIVLLSLAVLVCPAAAQTIWNGTNKTFTKADFADWTLAANQDCITTTVCLTRRSIEALFNAVSESSYSYGNFSPVDTEWAFQGLYGNPSSAAAITAANHANLTFTNFTDALDFNVGLRIVGRPGVLHIKSSNIYLNIQFSSWTQGVSEGASGGGFSYVRSTAGGTPTPPPPVPAPPALILTCTGLGAAALYELKRRLVRR